MSERSGQGFFGGGVIPFNPQDKLSLYQSYMPFVKNGGLYIPTTKKYDQGSEIFLLVRMPGESNERLPGVGKVVWINRSGTVSKPSGIGIQFSDTPENAILRDKIERLLVGVSPDTATYTM